MKYLLAPTLAACLAACLATASLAAHAQASGGGDTSAQQCAIGYVTGVGGAAQSMRDYLAMPDRDRYRYLTDNPLRCQVSDDGRTSGCTGVTSLRRDRVSVYDDSGGPTITVVARVELDQGTYPVIIVVPRDAVRCDE